MALRGAGRALGGALLGDGDFLFGGERGEGHAEGVPEGGLRGREDGLEGAGGVGGEDCRAFVSSCSTFTNSLMVLGRRLGCPTLGVDVRSPQRLPRVFARERKPHQLLDHLLVRAGRAVVDLAIELGRVVGGGGGGGARGGVPSSAGGRRGGGGFGLLGESVGVWAIWGRRGLTARRLRTRGILELGLWIQVIYY